MAREIIANEFEVDEAHSSTKSQSLEPDRFGYRSVHIVSKITTPRSKLIEWKDYRELWSEIQIRSVVQHVPYQSM